MKKILIKLNKTKKINLQKEGKKERTNLKKDISKERKKELF